MKTEIAMMCLTAMEITAILTHTDGAYFLPIVAAISAMAGIAARPQAEAVIKKLAKQ